MIKPQISLPKDKIDTFCKTYCIKELALFGSVLTNRFSETSDIDVLVEFEPAHVPGFFGLLTMEDELHAILGRKTDMHTPKDLSRYFRSEVLKTAYPLYGQGQFSSS